MKYQWVKKIILASALLFGTAAQAGVITDTEVVNDFLNGIGDQVSWTHDLNDDGFSLGSAISATLSIEFWDDGGRWDFGELSSIIVGTIDFLDGSFLYTPTSDWSGSLGFNSIASLNANGLLNVKVISLFGDFFIGNSVLEVTTADVASVPEPGSLLMFALGLLGLTVLRKKNAA